MIIKQFNNVSIEIREDGYFNLTQMAKAHNRKIQDYLRLESTQRFLKALEDKTGNHALIEINRGGRCPGTWGERRASLDAARWMSAEFHVVVIEWADEILSGRKVNIQSEDYHISQYVDIFSRTSDTLRKEVIVENPCGSNPKTRRFDMKHCSKDIYYEVKMHPINMNDIKEIFIVRKYPQILKNINLDYHLYIVSPYGITEEASCILETTNNISFLHGEDLALQAARLMLRDTPFAKDQILKHVLPQYSDILPVNWINLLEKDIPILEECNTVRLLPHSVTLSSLESNKGSSRGSSQFPKGKEGSSRGSSQFPKGKEGHEIPEPRLPSSIDRNVEDLIFSGPYPMGVCYKKRYPSKPFRAQFIYNHKTYYLGQFEDPIEAGFVVREAMLKVKGSYNGAIKPRFHVKE